MSSLRTEDLAQFTGSTCWFRHSFARSVIYTEGIRFVAEQGQAYWLIDAIASHLLSREFRQAAALDERIGLMHFWKLAVRSDHAATLTAVADSGEQPFLQQEIASTDFPLPALDVWVQNHGDGYTLMLPSEY